eukprot:3541148-Prymnesium_polylepis.1
MTFCQLDPVRTVLLSCKLYRTPIYMRCAATKPTRRHAWECAGMHPGVPARPVAGRHQHVEASSLTTGLSARMKSSYCIVTAKCGQRAKQSARLPSQPTVSSANEIGET